MEQAPAQRYQPDIANGLSQAQVQERIDSGWTNQTIAAKSKTVGQIKDLVLDDIVIFREGDQICADAVALIIYGQANTSRRPL